MNTPSKTIPGTLLPFFWHYIKKYWATFLILQLLYCALALDITIWPYIIMLFVDALANYTGDKSDMWQVLATPLWAGAIIWIWAEACYRTSGFISARLFPKLQASIRMNMFDYVQRHSHSFFSTHFAGSIAGKINDVSEGTNTILYLIMRLIIPIALGVIIAIILLNGLSPLFAVILLGWVLSHITIVVICLKRCVNSSDQHANAQNSLSGRLVDSLGNSSTVRLFSQHRFEKHFLGLFQQEEQAKNNHALLAREKMQTALGITCFLMAGIALNWFMLVKWQQDLITTGAVVFIFNTTWNITAILWQAGIELPRLVKEVGACRQALTLIQTPHGVMDAPNAAALKVSRGEIRFEGVSFYYTPSQYIFQDKTIVIDAGEKVGLVGFSGSGKTTFVNLILRYYDIKKGQILIDGQNIAKVTQDSVREQISMIPQDTSLFHRSLMDNIRYGRIDASDEEVIEASKIAHCHEFISKLPEGYLTEVGERGAKLSGGQRQRIAIARAILKNATILILDEATTALDSVTEKFIQDGLKKLMHGKTAVVIAHRLSTLCDMHRILVFKDGRVVEEGPHDKLLKANGHYATMWEMQAGGFLPETLEL